MSSGDQPAEHRPALPSSLARGILGLPGRASRRAGRMRPRWRATSMAVLVMLVAGSAAAAASLAGRQRDDAAAQRAQTAAMAAATTEIGQILSYDYRDLNADLARAASDTTGEFNGQFGVLSGQLIGPAAAQEHVVTKATVPDASVISSTGGEVVVLLFVDQSTTNKTQKKAQQNVSQVRVTMENVGGRWLVEQFQAL
jgi:Mce-associated membrane protein